jgi:hypothetical protein
MRKAFIFAVLLFLSVTTYSLLPQEALYGDFSGISAESAVSSTEILYQASPYGGLLPFLGECVPQPATVCVLTLSSLVLFNRRIRAPRPEIY